MRVKRIVATDAHNEEHVFTGTGSLDVHTAARVGEWPDKYVDVHMKLETATESSNNGTPSQK